MQIPAEIMPYPWETARGITVIYSSVSKSRILDLNLKVLSGNDKVPGNSIFCARLLPLIFLRFQLKDRYS